VNLLDKSRHSVVGPNEAQLVSRPAPSSLAIWAAMISVYIAWGSTYLAIRFAVQTMPPFLMAGCRFLIAGLILYGLRRSRGDRAPSRTEWRSTIIVGLLLLVGGNGSVVWAEQRVVSGVAALLVGSSPLWMILIDALRPGEKRPGWLALVGVLIGFGGIALLIGPGEFSSSGQKVDSLGALVLILAAFSWSLGSIYSRQATLPSSPLLGTGMEMIVGGVGLVILGALTGEFGRLNLAAISARSLWGLAYLIVFGSWVGFGAYTWLLRVAPLSFVSTYAYVNPVVAVVMGYWLAAEPLTPLTLVATAVIVGSVALTKVAGQVRSRPPAPARAGDG
jgi:drug/metabolite transporter (DMT)-like permease